VQEARRVKDPAKTRNRNLREVIRNLFDHSCHAVFILDLEGRFLEANRAAVERLGYSLEELRKKTPESIDPPEFAALVPARLQQIRKAKHAEFETVQLKKDGSRIPVELSCWRIEYAGQPAILSIARDVTQPKKAQEVLQESEKKYRELVDNSPVAVIRTNREGEVLYANRSMAAMFDVPCDDDVLGLNVLNYYKNPKERESVLQTLDKKGGVSNFELEAVTVTGRSIRILFHAVSEGANISATMVDITERKHMEEALRESKELYETLVRTSPDAVVVMDLEGRLEHVSEKALALHGFKSAEDFTWKYARDMLAPEEGQTALKTMQEVVSRGEARNVEWVMMRKDGSRFIGELNAALVKDAKGNPKGVMGIARDITERKKEEALLARERELLAATLRSIADGVVTTDAGGRILLMNEAAQKITGWQEGEALGRPLDEVLPLIDEKTRERLVNPIETILQSRDISELEGHTILSAKDGIERVVAYSGTPTFDEGGAIAGAVLAFRDVTERRRMEEEILKAQKIESIGILAGGIAHDFNNILTAVLGNINMAKIDSEPGTELSQYLADAERAAIHAKDLTHQLLTFSRGGEPIKKVVPIEELLRKGTSFAARGSGVRCDFSLPDDLWPLEVDEGQMSQVIHNITINAVQAMPEGGTLQVRAENRRAGASAPLTLRRSDHVKITFRDQGPGIPKELLSKVFDPYFTTKAEGSGLGLSISYSVMKSHGGLLTVDSEEGAGAAFHLFLPVTHKTVPRKKVAEEEAITGIGRILLMDDDEMVRKAAGAMIARLGYRVDCARDGEEAVALYRRARDSGDRYHVVIVDLTVPAAMGGKEAIRRFREIDPNVKAIVSSGYSNDPIMADFKKYGFKAVLAKPYKIPQLSETLCRVMAGKE
jgi:PAS domain S-box-containing protein